MKRVTIESPLSGDRVFHKLYARACSLDCLLRGESPYASHLFFDHEDLLNDDIQHERHLGIQAGFAWARTAELRVFYLDLGESAGMKLGREDAAAFGQATEDRRLFWATKSGFLLSPDASPEAKLIVLGNTIAELKQQLANKQ